MAAAAAVHPPITEEEILEAYTHQQEWAVPFRQRVKQALADRLQRRDVPDVYQWVLRNRYGISKSSGDQPSAEKPYSHTALDARYSRVYSKISITDDKRNEFYQEIQQSIRKEQLLFLDERTDPGAITPLLMDIDLKLDVRFFARLTKRQLLPLAGFVHYVVSQLFFKNEQNCECVVVARDAVLTRSKDGSGWYLKCGLHLHWPDLFLGPTERIQLYHFVCRWFSKWSPDLTFPIFTEGQEADTYSFDDFAQHCLHSAPLEQGPNVARSQNEWTNVFDQDIAEKPHARMPYCYKTEPVDKAQQCKCKDVKTCLHVNHVGSIVCYEYCTTLDQYGMEVDPGYTTAGSLDIAQILEVISLRRKPPGMRATPVRLTEQEVADISRFANRDRDPRDAPQLNSENDWSSDEKQLKLLRADSRQAQLIITFAQCQFADEIDANSLRFGSIRRTPTYMARFKSTNCCNVVGGMHRTNGAYLRVTRTHFVRRCFSLADETRSTLGLACSKYQLVVDVPFMMVDKLFATTNHTTHARSKTYAPPPNLVPDTFFFNNIPEFCREALNRQLHRFARPVNAGQKDYLLLQSGARVPVPPRSEEGDADADADGAAGAQPHEAAEPDATEPDADLTPRPVPSKRRRAIVVESDEEAPLSLSQSSKRPQT